jgi:uncharacterized protein (DUF1778 family)
MGGLIVGRKALSGTPKSERPLRIRLTDEERALLDQAAEAEGKPTSSWLRDVALKLASKHRKTSK